MKTNWAHVGGFLLAAPAVAVVGLNVSTMADSVRASTGLYEKGALTRDALAEEKQAAYVNAAAGVGIAVLFIVGGIWLWRQGDKK
ncbi:MAG TPA: hypothetical protein VHN99_12355 [Deinococcales bacterium]|nr:hypothetical protein [Deinococcales bacterium]